MSFLTKKQLLTPHSRSPVPEESVLSTGERVLIRALTPAEQLALADCSECDRFTAYILHGLIVPHLSRKEVLRALNASPFRMLMIEQAILKKTEEYAQESLADVEEMQNTVFLDYLQKISERISGESVPQHRPLQTRCQY